MTSKELANLIYNRFEYEFEECNCDDCIFKNEGKDGITCKIKQLHVWNADGEDYDCECHTTEEVLEQVFNELESEEQ